MNTSPLSIYFHWPYCKSKCPYCDFFKRVQKNIPQKEIIDTYIKELDYYHTLTADRVVRSVFFGGGTPSLLEPAQINRLLEHIQKLWPLENGVEISLEANPNSEYPEMFKQLSQSGINRLSLGVQALNDDDLHFLGRTHNLNQALHSIEEVVTHFENHSIDLIYSRPNQCWKSWEKELQQALSFNLKHLSLYQLTIEEGTVFFNKNIKALDDENAAQMYVQTVEFLNQNGYPRYEVSNFAQTAYESKHNKCYWLGDEYIGIGESAHGRLKLSNEHFALVHPHQQEKLKPQERAEELIIMGLRLRDGINKLHFEQICGLNFDTLIGQKTLAQLSELGLIINTPSNIAATNSGFLVLNKIIEQLCLSI